MSPADRDGGAGEPLRQHTDSGVRRTQKQFLLFGGKDASSAALIQGSTLAGLLLDETALMPRAFVEQAVARCSVRGSRLWFNCNPEGPEHWFYKEWIEKAESRGALRLHFTMEDNPGLPPEIRQRYERLYTGVFYRRFVLGEWAAAQGLVYDFFDPDKDAAEVPGWAVFRVAGLCGLRDGEPAVHGTLGRKERRVVSGGGGLLRFPAGGAAENRRGVR